VIIAAVLASSLTVAVRTKAGKIGLSALCMTESLSDIVPSSFVVPAIPTVLLSSVGLDVDIAEGVADASDDDRGIGTGTGLWGNFAAGERVFVAGERRRRPLVCAHRPSPPNSESAVW